MNSPTWMLKGLVAGPVTQNTIAVSAIMTAVTT
jgi:hypothetical protein